MLTRFTDQKNLINNVKINLYWEIVINIKLFEFVRMVNMQSIAKIKTSGSKIYLFISFVMSLR